MNNELRLYTFTNFYLSSIQAGIQSAHLVGELVNRYLQPDVAIDPHAWPEVQASYIFKQWCKEHKTMIVLSAGANQDLHELKQLVSADVGAYYIETPVAVGRISEYKLEALPCAWFHEDEPSLAGILTCVGIVLPSRVFNAVRHNTNPADWIYEDDEFVEYYPSISRTAKLLEVVKSCGLAR
jgi:hypothetical protein